jgi:3',5'-cyclic AMP phosphodiesterase CpdA
MNWTIIIYIGSLLIGMLIHSDQKPTQIHMAQGINPSYMTISWVTSEDSNSKISYGKNQFELNNFAQGQSIKYDFNTLTFGNYTSGQIHHVELINLKPNSKYFYQIESGDINWFSTGPEPGSTIPLVFGIIGDIGQTSDTAKTIGHLANSHKINMILHAGDLAYADCNQKLWDSYGELIELVAKSFSWMVGPGNHEIEYLNENTTLFKAFEYRYRMPQVKSAEFGSIIIPSAINKITTQPYCSPSEFLAEYNYGNSFYSFDIGMVHIIYLNSYTPSDLNSAQYSWLETDLKNSNANRLKLPWIIVVMHCPWYNSNIAHQNEKQTLLMRETIEDIFFKYHVNLVITGHVHAYERTYPVYKDKININGPIYITIGDGGNIEGHATNYLEPQPIWSAYRNGTQYGYGTLSIINSTQMYWKWYRNVDSQYVFRDKIQINNFF